MSRTLRFIALVGALILSGSVLRAEEVETKPTGIEFRDGDRVVFLGNAFFDRDQELGYLETELTRLWPDRDVRFRNLGKTGDTVWGDAWAKFETVAEGFQRRQELLVELEPTLILVAFGMNESFEGEAGLPKFLEGLDTLLDSLTATGARLVLISPTLHEKLPPPLPSPTEHNKALRLYRNAMAKVARDRGLAFIDLIQARIGDGSQRDQEKSWPETVEGIHLNAFGYWRAAETLGRAFSGDKIDRGWSLQVVVGGPSRATTSNLASVSDLERTEKGLRFRSRGDRLPSLPIPGDLPKSLDPHPRQLQVKGLAAGLHSLWIDGEPYATASVEEWEQGVTITKCPERQQVETLRQAIIAKNRLLDYRYRPANWTYLYGFRKHEQGQNAGEIPKFDPLVAEKEAEIAKLRQPLRHDYELVREDVEP